VYTVFYIDRVRNNNNFHVRTHTHTHPSTHERAGNSVNYWTVLYWSGGFGRRANEGDTVEIGGRMRDGVKRAWTTDEEISRFRRSRKRQRGKGTITGSARGKGRGQNGGNLRSSCTRVRVCVCVCARIIRLRGLFRQR